MFSVKVVLRIIFYSFKLVKYAKFELNDVMFNKMLVMFFFFRLRIRNKRENSANANASSCVKMRRVPGMREGAGEMRHGGNNYITCIQSCVKYSTLYLRYKVLSVPYTGC